MSWLAESSQSISVNKVVSNASIFPGSWYATQRYRWTSFYQLASRFGTEICGVHSPISSINFNIGFQTGTRDGT